MRNKCFIHMCKNPSGKMLQGFNKLLEGIFLPPAGCGSVFPMKSYQDAWRNSSWLARGQMNMTDEAKVQRPICSTFEALVVWGAVGHCCGEKLGPFCWPMPAAATAVGMLLVDLLSIRLRCNDFARIQKSCSGSDQQETTKLWPWPFFHGSASSLFSAPPLSWLVLVVIRSMFCDMSQSDGEMGHCCIQ